jgi:hypothetical protein
MSERCGASHGAQGRAASFDVTILPPRKEPRSMLGAITSRSSLRERCTMTSDEKRIIELLCGRSARDGRGRLRVTYFRKGSPDELEARRALTRMLRTSLPLDPGVRFVIADLFDPDLSEVDRIIRLEYRRRGKRSNAAAEKEIAEFIWAQRRGGAKMMKSAVPAAMEKFGLKEKRILAIWKNWQPILQRLKRIDLDGNPVNPFAAVRHNRD